MTGSWQHEIPAFLQRGFGIRRSGQPNETWVFAKGETPEPKPITDTNADTHFYSEPSPDPWTTLDGKITKYETPLADHVNAARRMQPGERLDSDIAAKVVTHLAVRTRHVREMFQRGLRDVAQGALNEFADSATVQRVMGLDSLVPSDIFSNSLRDELRRSGLAKEAPESLAVQIMFQLARERFDQFSPATMDGIRLVGTQIIENAANLIQQAHNSALTRVMETPEHAWDYLRTLHWTVEAAVGPAILPDCVALAIDRDGTARPLPLANRETLANVLLPLSSKVLLVGVKTVNEKTNLVEFNQHAAACCYHHYQASANTPELANLSDLIGSRSLGVVQSLIQETLSEQFPRSQSLASPDSISQQTSVPSEPVPYVVSFLDCADQATAENIAAVVNLYVAKVAAVLPLSRLESITFAADYEAASRSIDRDIPRNAPIYLPFDTGSAQRIAVLKDNTVKVRVVVVGEIGHALLDEASADSWAGYVLMYQLALVSLIEIVDMTLPGSLLKPIESHHEARLFECVNSALDAYVAASFSAGMGDTEKVTAHYRSRFVAALERASTEVPEARLAYRKHADLEVLLRVAAPAVRDILECASNLVGHCDALGLAITDPGDPLAVALEQRELARWLAVFQSDLRKFRQRLRHWNSFDEFVRFNRHAERLFWQFGMFPWCTPEGTSRVEVPLTTDDAALSALDE